MTPEQLKASILQMAIEGRLVPQLDDEPAVEIDAAELDEVPFAIPEKWKWVRLENLFNFVDYRGKTPTKTASGVRLMTASNVRKGYIDHTRIEFISEEEFATRKSRGISAKGDILFTTEAPLGNAALADLDIYSAGQRVITLQSDTVDKQLYVYFLISPYFQCALVENATGTTAQGIKAAKLKKLTLPVPPLGEQRRIVSRLNKILPLIEEYGKSYIALQSIEKTLPDQLRASLLQEAIQGKLVPQLDDEPAVEIDAAEPEEVPFAIPEKWKWCTINDIVTKLTDGEHKTPKYQAEGIPFVSVKNISSGKLTLRNTKYIKEEDYKLFIKRCFPQKGDILLSKVGTTGVSVIVDTDNPFALFVSVALLKLKDNLIYNKFAYFLLQSPLVQVQAKENTRGVGNKNWVLSAIGGTLIALPPIAEQYRIVARLEELLPHVRSLQ